MTHEEKADFLFVQYSVWTEEFMENGASFNSMLIPRTSHLYEVMKLLVARQCHNIAIPIVVFSWLKMIRNATTSISCNPFIQSITFDFSAIYMSF